MAHRLWQEGFELRRVDVGLLDEVGGVEFALEDALSAANAEVRVDDGFAAAEAARGFFLGLFFLSSIIPATLSVAIVSFLSTVLK